MAHGETDMYHNPGADWRPPFGGDEVDVDGLADTADIDNGEVGVFVTDFDDSSRDAESHFGLPLV
jgi:hypothetical protein